MNQKNLIYIILGVVILAIIVWAVTSRDTTPQPPPAPGEIGLEGTVSAISEGEDQFTLHQVKLVQGENGYTTEETTYTITFTDETVFFEYTSPQNLELDIPLQVQPTELEVNRNVRIDTIKAEGSTRTAIRVYILPGSATAEPVE